MLSSKAPVASSVAEKEKAMPTYPQAMKYDVGLITRRLQSEFRLFDRDPRQQTTNEATPQRIAVLLNSLQKLTDQIVAKRETMSDWVPDMGIVLWDKDMAQWQERLAVYKQAVASAAPTDRAAILWTVTAPLLLGFYGGADSDLPQQPLDAVTPFSLANQLDVAEGWREERWKLFLEDLKNGFENLPKIVPWWVWAALGTGAVLVVGSMIYGATGRRRNPELPEPKPRTRKRAA